MFTWQVSQPHLSTDGRCNSASVVILYPRRIAPLSFSGSLRSPSNGCLRILSPCGTNSQREQPTKQPNTTIFVTSTKWSVLSATALCYAYQTANTHTKRMMRAGGWPNLAVPYAPSPQLRAQAPSRGVPPPTPETHSRPIGRSGERLRPIGRAFLVGYRFVLRYPNKARLCRMTDVSAAICTHVP